MMFLPNLTARQYRLLYAIRKGRPDGNVLDIDELCAQFGVTKQAMQFSIRFLVAKGAVRKIYQVRRRRRRVCYILTSEASFDLSPEKSLLWLHLLTGAPL